MRISDGSSDVCSSDLVRPPAVAVEGGTAVLLQYGTRDPDVARGADVPPAVGVGVCDIDVVAADLLRRVRVRHADERLAVGDSDGPGRTGGQSVAGDQTGRASCWERGVPDVEIQGG